MDNKRPNKQDISKSLEGILDYIFQCNQKSFFNQLNLVHESHEMPYFPSNPTKDDPETFKNTVWELSDEFIMPSFSVKMYGDEVQLATKMKDIPDLTDINFDEVHKQIRANLEITLAEHAYNQESEFLASCLKSSTLVDKHPIDGQLPTDWLNQLSKRSKGINRLRRTYRNMAYRCASKVMDEYDKI